MSPIYTRRGDTGKTSLNPYQIKVSKSSCRIEALGAVDELNALLGVIRAVAQDEHLTRALEAVQHVLFRVQARLATVSNATNVLMTPAFDAARIQDLERMIDELEAGLKPLTQFILPGGAPTAAFLQYARAVCRRAEREVVRFTEEGTPLDPNVLVYLNRLSDALFMLARAVNHRTGIKDRHPDYYSD